MPAAANLIVRPRIQHQRIVKIALIHRLVSPSEQPYLIRAALLFAGVVVLWAVVHDMYLISVEPRHFTEYHRELLPISNHYLLALQYATVATFGPGLCFGFLAYFACRTGSKAKASLFHVWLGFVALIIAIELVLIGLGHYSRSQFKSGLSPLYPEFLYPELSSGIVYTQTVNISAYLIAPALGALYLLCVYLKRRK